MDDYGYDDDSGEYYEEDYYEDEADIEEQYFEEEVEDEDEEEILEDEDEEEIIEDNEDSEKEEVEDEEEDFEEIEEQDDLISLEMTSLRVYEEEEEDVSELVPLGMTSHRIIYEDEDDYMDEEVHELITSRMTSSRILYEDEEEQLDELILPEITSPSPRVISEGGTIFEDEREQVDELVPLEINPPRVLLPVIHGRNLQGSVAINDGLLHDSNECEGSLQGNHENGNVADVCPICFEAWTSGGNHQVCCLPCGHVYGMSCIKKWVQSSGKCPQCKSVCTLKDIIVLYATRLCIADKELHKTSVPNFPFTKEGFSALQQYAFSLQQRVEAVNLKADFLCSRMKSLEQSCKEHMGSEQQSTEH